MISAAHQTGHTKVLVGDSATRLGIKILSSITQGRGAHLAAQVVNMFITNLLRRFRGTETMYRVCSVGRLSRRFRGTETMFVLKWYLLVELGIQGRGRPVFKAPKLSIFNIA